MIPPMRAALQDTRTSDTSHLRQVVFLTDGAIGNEEQLFATISKGLGRTRVFMVGIGSAPNSYLMTRAAELGRGTFTHIGEAAEVTARMQDLFSKIGSPVVTEMKAELLGNSAKITPDMLPDLYRGEPVLLMAEAKDLEWLAENQRQYRHAALGSDASDFKSGERRWHFQALGPAPDCGL